MSSADYFGLEVIDRSDLTICNDPPLNLDVCDIHVVFDDPADRLISVAFSNVSTTDPAGFYQHTLNGDTAPGCNLIPVFPTLVCDSFVTVGVECDADGSSTDPDFDSTGFNNSGKVSGGWFNSSPANGQGAPDANGRVMIARVSYKQNKNTSGDVCVFAKLAGSQDITSFLLQPFDCSRPGGGLPPGCGDPEAGSCFDPEGTGSPFCDCFPICDAVCATDPFCCENEWEMNCECQACILYLANPIHDCDNCNGNMQDGFPVLDGVDIANGTSLDCNENGIPDECEIVSMDPEDGYFCDPEGCDPICDLCQGGSQQGCNPLCFTTCNPDCNGNGVPDECDLASGTSADCNCNKIADECDISSGSSLDADLDGVPDECQDCNFNGTLDSEDIANMISTDCNGNGVPDECDVAVRGPIMLSADDADDGLHCPDADDCGRLYPALFEWALANSRVTEADEGFPIAAIGINGMQAENALDDWLADIDPPPGVKVVTDITTPSIDDVNFADFAVVYIPSTAEGDGTPGGITSEQLDALNLRQEDIKEYVNFLGGGLIALTEPVANGYGWLPLCLDIEDEINAAACPTPELALIPNQTATCENLTRPPNPPAFPSYHSIFIGPPGLFGLDALAVEDELPSEEQNPVIVGQLYFFADLDCDANGTPDTCETCSGDPGCEDCNDNGFADGCDIASGRSDDDNTNGIPDECEECGDCATDVNGDGITGPFDLATLLGGWGPTDPGNCLDANGDGILGPFDLATLLGAWGNCP